MMSDSSSSLIGVPDSNAAVSRRPRLSSVSSSGTVSRAISSTNSLNGSLMDRTPAAMRGARQACLRRRDLPLNERNQSPLCAGVAIDVALRRFDGTMPRQQLHVAQAAPGAVDVAGGHRDEAAPAGMRR